MALGDPLRSPVPAHRVTATGMARRSRRAADGRAARDPAALEVALGHRFGDHRLLEEALTHASLAGGGRRRGRRRRSNERLEFLGDRVLGLVVARLLLERFPADDEGALGARLSHLVNRETLADIARELDLAAWLRLSRGEEEAGGRANPGILADCLEAVIGALFLDGGLEAAERFVRDHWTSRVEALEAPPRDAKTALQEWAQGHGLSRPVYHVLEAAGPDHAPRFRVEVSVEGMPAAVGEGGSKRAAEQVAARRLLERIETGKA